MYIKQRQYRMEQMIMLYRLSGTRLQTTQISACCLCRVF
jgi:hypothetical protein